MGLLAAATLFALAQTVEQRRAYGEPELPAGCRADFTSKLGLRLSLPAGVWWQPVEPLASTGVVPAVVRAAAGDFAVRVSVRLTFDPAAGAAGVTRMIIRNGVKVAEAVPTVGAGIALQGLADSHMQVWLSAERRGEVRTLTGHYMVYRANGTGEGGSTSLPVDLIDPFHVTITRRAGTVAVQIGADNLDRNRWLAADNVKLVMTPLVQTRLFATGNLDKPFAVEFDRFSVTPLPAADNK